MQIRESNFFTTEIPPSNRYSMAQNNDNADESVQKKSPAIRIREAKSEAKKVVNLYRRTLQEYMKVKNSVEESNSKTHKLREEFVKLYGNKKSKYANKSMMQAKKHLDEEFKLESSNRVRTKRLSNDLGIMYMRNECEVNNHKLKDENRKIAEDFKKQLRLIKKEELDEAREKYQQVKRGQTQFIIRKKNMSAMISTRAHHNHLVKVNREIEMLNSYTKLLTKIDELRQVDVVNKTDLDAFSKTFFITTKNSFT